MQLCEAEKQALRARLASRQSFFGGSLSTAQDSAAPGWIPAALRCRDEPSNKRLKPKSQATENKSKTGPTSGVLAPGPARKRTVNYSDFASLGSETPPPERSSQQSTATAKQPETDRAASNKSVSTKASPTRAVTPSRASPLPVTKKPAVTKRPGSHLPPRGVTPPSGLARHSPPRQPPQSQFLAKRPVKSNGFIVERRVQGGKKGQATRKDSISPQALGGPTRSQKANQAWAEAAAKFRNSNASTTPARSPSPLGSAGAFVSVPPVRSAASVMKGQAAERARVNASSSAQPSEPPQQAAKFSPNSRFRQIMSLIGKDLSKLPEWQRLILEKKQKEHLRSKRQREEEESETEEEEEMDDFLDNDDSADWRQELKAITGYDPAKFKNERFDDRSMEADWKSIQAEERRSARMGRSEDEKAEAEELARQRSKATAKKKRQKTSSFIVD